MAGGHAPGLRVAALARIERTRRLPIEGAVLVAPGQRVRAEDVVARAEVPGNVRTVDVATALGIPEADLRAHLLRGEGERVATGESIAASRSLFGLLRAECRSPCDGTVESVSTVTGRVTLREPPAPVGVNAYIDGRVARVLPSEGAVVETAGALVQGIFGVGGEATGILHPVVACPEEAVTVERLAGDLEGAVLVGGSTVGHEAVRLAAARGARALVVGAIPDGDLRALLGYDRGVAITGQEAIGITLVLTEGFGRLPMAERTFALLAGLAGRRASVNGATQIRAGVVRPEIIVPDPAVEPEGVPEGDGGASAPLAVGRAVRGLREPWLGRIGEVVDLPREPRTIETEARVRVVVVRFPGGETATLPRANVEIIDA